MSKMPVPEPMRPNLPWVEKYRPNALQELISHEDIIGTIRKFIQEDKLPHLLFYGPPGTGKTLLALAAGLQKVDLHVDHDHCGRCEIH